MNVLCVIVFCVRVSSEATHLISFYFIFSRDSCAKRNFIAFQSNNNKFVPIDLLNQLLRSISFDPIFSSLKCLQPLHLFMRFALDGVKYSILLLKTNNFKN